jgi:hypothetical protein
VASKYSVIIGALLEKGSLQTAITAEQKNLILTLNKIVIAPAAMTKLKLDLEKGLSNVQIDINTDKTKDIGKKISDNIAVGIGQSGTTGKVVASNFEQIELAIAKSNKQLELMAVQSPKAFGSEKVQDTVNVLKDYQTRLSNNTISMQKFNGQMALTNKEFQIAKTGIANVNHDGQGMIQMFELAAKKILIWAAGTTAIYGTINQIKNMEQYVVDLNKAMTDIQLVNNMTNEGIAQLATEYNGLAKEMGATTLEVAKGSTEWINFSSL